MKVTAFIIFMIVGCSVTAGDLQFSYIAKYPESLKKEAIRSYRALFDAQKILLPKDISLTMADEFADLEKKQQEQPEKVFILVVHNAHKQLVGSVVLIETNPSIYYVAKMFVVKEFCGKGIGQAIIKYVIKDKNPVKLTLWVYDGHVAGENFYKKCGFKQVNDSTLNEPGKEFMWTKQ